MARLARFSFLVVLLLSAFFSISVIPAHAVTAVDTTEWCGYNGAVTGCKALVAANFPKPWKISGNYVYSQWGYVVFEFRSDLSMTEDYRSYVSKLCYASHGETPMVKVNSMWSSKKFHQCYALALTAFNKVLDVTKKVLDNVESANSFSAQLSACTKGETFGITNFKWYPRFASCLLKVAFVPKNLTSVINDTPATATKPKVVGLKTAISTRVPFAYGVAGAKVFASFISATQSEDRACTTGKGVVSGNISLPEVNGVVHDFDLKLPCQPPAGLKSLRGYMVAFIWLGTGIGLWGIASRAVST